MLDNLDELCRKIKGETEGAVDVEAEPTQHFSSSQPASDSDRVNTPLAAPLNLRLKPLFYETFAYATIASIGLYALRHFFASIAPLFGLLLTIGLFVWFCRRIIVCSKAIDRAWRYPSAPYGSTLQDWNASLVLMQQAIEAQMMQAQIGIALAVGLAIVNLVA